MEGPRSAKIEQAEKFAANVAEKLGVDAGNVLPAYEDQTHWLLKENSLPNNVDPSDSKLADPEERSRMAQVFQQGLNVPRGFVLPVQRWNAKAASRWCSAGASTTSGRSARAASSTLSQVQPARR